MSRGVSEDRTNLHHLTGVNNNIGSTDDRQKSTRVENARAHDSDLSSQFKLAYRALMLVSRGASEREAVQRAAASDPRLNGVKRKALALVLGTVDEQDVLDIHIHNALPEEKIGMSARCLFRLAAYAMRRLGAKGQVRRMEHTLRVIAPIELLPKLRINPLRNRGRTTLPKELGVLARRLTKVLSTSGVYIVGGSLSAFAGFFSSGLLQMQDLASYLAITAGDPRPGEKVLDLCAAPGAKTAAIAQKMKNRGTVVSVDYSPVRMKGWKRETQRLGVKIADPVIGDAARLGLRESFDLAVIDPPCTGTGVFDRYPRMKWHLSPQSVDRYSILQRRFLESAAALSSEDGRILYCTCSLTIEENEQVISAFLKSHPEFETRPILEHYGSPGLMGLADCRRFYPHRDRTAGYFIARLERTM